MTMLRLHPQAAAALNHNPQVAHQIAALLGLAGGGGPAPNIQGNAPPAPPVSQTIPRSPIQAPVPGQMQPIPGPVNGGFVPPQYGYPQHGYPQPAQSCWPANWWEQYYGVAPFDPRMLAYDAQAAADQDASRQTPIPFSTPVEILAGAPFIIQTTPTVPVCGGRFIFSRQMAQDFAFSSFTVAQKELFAGAGLIPADSFAADAIQQPMIEIPMVVPGQPMVLTGQNISSSPRRLIGVLWAKKLPFANRMCPG